ncbi:hypothetical protein Tco_0180282 [Tanacetum coccineum]
MNKSVVYTDHSALKYLFNKKDAKARLLRLVYSSGNLIYGYRTLLTNSLKPLVSGVVSRFTRASHPLCEFSTDKSKITRKQSKASKHGHENQKSSKRSQRSKALANFLLQGPFLQFPKVIYNLKERKERQGPNVQTSQSSTVLTVEKGAGTPFTIHRLPQFHCHGKIKGQIEIKGCVGQFKEAQAQMKGQISLIKGILILAQAQRPRKQ